MAQPPAGASLLFSAISTEAFIKERKNGSFQMEMKDVETINWFTERPERAEGSWKPKKLVKQWENYFVDSEPNAQTTFRVTGIAGEQGFATFKMFKPKINSKRNLKFKVKPISENSKEKLANLVGKELDIASLFIDDATPGLPACFPDCYGAQLEGFDMSDKALYADFATADLTGANLSKAWVTGANLSSTNLSGAILTDANLSNADLYHADLTDGADLTDATLIGTDLTGAYLNMANFSGANLRSATLTDAYLTDANLTGANLVNANLTNAVLNDAIWSNTICPDGTKNKGSSPCMVEQLLLD